MDSSNPFLMDDMMGGGFMDSMASSNPFLASLSGKEDTNDIFGVPNAADYNPELNPFLMGDVGLGGSTGAGLFDSMSYTPEPASYGGYNNVMDTGGIPSFSIESSKDSPKSSNGAKDLILSVTSHLESTSDALLLSMQTAKTPIASPDGELHNMMHSHDSPMALTPEPPHMNYGSTSMGFGSGNVSTGSSAKSFNPFADFMDTAAPPVTSASSDLGMGISQTSKSGGFMGQALFGGGPAAPEPQKQKEEPLVDLLGDFMSGSSHDVMDSVPAMVPNAGHHQKGSLLDEGLDFSTPGSSTHGSDLNGTDLPAATSYETPSAVSEPVQQPALVTQVKEIKHDL